MTCEKVLHDCLICLERVTDSNSNILLKCDCCKNYHIYCLQKWIDERNSCPICKTFVVNNRDASNKDLESQPLHIFLKYYFIPIPVTIYYIIMTYYFPTITSLVFVGYTLCILGLTFKI